MGIPNSFQREKLESLWSYVVSNKMKQELLKDNVVPQQLLDDKAILLVPHVFEDVHDFNWRCSVESLTPNMALPPVLFSPFKSLGDHPIDLDAMDPISRQAATTFVEYGSPDLSGYANTSPYSCPGYFSHRIQNWAEGAQIRRQIPPGDLNLTEFRGITPVHKYQGLLADSGFYDLWRDGWDTMIYEYDKEHFDAILLHVILLTSQGNKDYNGSMLRGELAVILTAMRNRAIQTVKHEEEQRQEEEEPEEASKESELIFSSEARFPLFDNPDFTVLKRKNLRFGT
ncbi:hypothetical protein UA08_02309 [Talaromyces atroroseus]|uniref:Uncharacterized protein n=1 Tax=Talaromyces atroroseus TaxID=1441469 RepID=A0A225B2T0_TALAT|nr:hypothetical protein UA08_02309 [Talaromyces atroroseus]OKL62289.1 hypothetical protein UA08_02309 [Talaromyces atroroseus]